MDVEGEARGGGYASGERVRGGEEGREEDVEEDKERGEMVLGPCATKQADAVADFEVDAEVNEVNEEVEEEKPAEFMMIAVYDGACQRRGGAVNASELGSVVVSGGRW